MRRRVYILALALVLVGSLAMLSPGITSAQSTTDEASDGTGVDQPDGTIWFVLGPEGKANGAHFDIQLEPGQSTEVTAAVGNGSAVPVKARVYAADAFSAQNGGFALKDSTAKPTGPTAWLDFKTETIDFKPGQGVKKTFTVTVPPGTAPGQYVTGLAIETADPAAIENISALTQTIRLATAVVITVPGPIAPNFDVSDLALTVTKQTTLVGGTIANTGNIRVRPEGVLTLSDSAGDKIVDVPIKMGSVYAHNTTTFQIGLPSAIPEGTYLATVNLIDPDTQASASLTGESVTAAPPVAPAAISISNVQIAPSPSADNVVFVQVTVTITNSGSQATGAAVTLRVLRDGNVVDEKPLATSLSIPAGETVVDQPYLPADGTWAPGTYSFEVVLSTTDVNTGATTQSGTFTVNQTITIP